MAIKTQTIAGQRRVLVKVVNGVRRVSCSCCCFCGSYNLDDFIPVRSSTRSRLPLVQVSAGCGDPAAFNALRPGPRHVIKKACLRWLCRKVDLVNNQPVANLRPIGGPTTNNRNLNDLLLGCLGPRADHPGLANGEEYGECYLYEFEFYGWALWGKRDDGPGWVSSDLLFDLARADTGPTGS
jgi:hypothetical protein